MTAERTLKAQIRPGPQNRTRVYRLRKRPQIRSPKHREINARAGGNLREGRIDADELGLNRGRLQSVGVHLNERGGGSERNARI